MSELTVRLDMDRVQSSVQASIRPAVESALASHDIKKIIEGELKAPVAKRSQYMSVYDMISGNAEREPLLDSLVKEAIHNLAKEYVERELRAQRESIEEAFRLMLAKSSSGLARSFANAIQKGLESDWSFDLDIKVTHAAPEREREYSDD